MLRWFHALMPKEDRFFNLFDDHASAVVAGAEAMRAMLEGGDAIALNYQAVMDREHEADNATREVLIAVRRSFITPFDRSNIRDLITAMDNSIDQMQKTAKAVKLFDVTSFTAQHSSHNTAVVTLTQCAKRISSRRRLPSGRPSDQFRLDRWWSADRSAAGTNSGSRRST